LFKPRPAQKKVLAYRGGKMGVSAVPGSGKTQTLSALAAGLIASGVLSDDQEVLIVTLVNSAVDNFSQRIAGFISEKGLLPHLGYRVRTLHGLAHDIVRERPALVGLSDDFQIVDERAAAQILEAAVQAWLRNNPHPLDDYLKPELDENYRDWLRHKKFPELLNGLAGNFIRYAKSNQLTPEALYQKLERLPVPLPLAQIGAAIYADYERALLYRGAVDFDDLIRLALQALHQDEKFVERLRRQWPFILEDEAQDSSRLQEEILKLLSGQDGNWVRVGDPNQAIYETFTTASPRFLREFLKRDDVTPRQLPNSGRSTPSIMALANHLVEWTRTVHPVPDVRTALDKPLIKPTSHRDPQPNPPDDPTQIYLQTKKFTPEEELKAVADSLERWLPTHPEDTIAVLVPRNTRGYELSEVLKDRKIAYVEMLRSSNATRVAADALATLLAYLADPGSPRKLAEVYQVWQRVTQEARETEVQPAARPRSDKVAALVSHCGQVEDFLWPQPDRDWLESLGLGENQASLYDELVRFRNLAQRWQGTALLPVDQAVLTLAQDLFTSPTDLAVAHKLAVVLRQAGEAHQDWRLPQMSEEIAVIARNQRRFLGFSEDDTGFDPDKYRGKVVISTIHKAKGLEWDRVYLLSANNYDFPSGMEYDSYISEKPYFRDGLNLEAEALAQLETAISTDEYQWYQEGQATLQARQDYTAERLRLLYVGITRAKKELVITWNTGRDGRQQPAVPLVELQSFWEEHRAASTP
jgi:DNA helicase-2/ATP-dependent DNA helicase PcrA